MKLLKAIKSAFESAGIGVFLFWLYAYKAGSFGTEELLICFGVGVAVVWITNKTLRWQMKRTEPEECPYCGAAGGGTRLGKIRRMDVDEMGEFLMKWGIACIKDEEPRDVFKWLGCRGEIWTEDE